MNGDAADWGLREHLAASILDVERLSLWVQVNANKPRHQRSKPPEPIPRPGISTHVEMSDEELRGRLLDFRARTAS